MKKLRIAVIVLSTLFVLLLGFSLLWYLPYHIDPPAPPVLYAHYESAVGTLTWIGMQSGHRFGNFVVSQAMSGFSPDTDLFGASDAHCPTITVPPGAMLRFTNSAPDSKKRYRFRKASPTVESKLIALKDYTDAIKRPYQETERSSAYEFDYSAPETSGQYVLWLNVHFARNKRYHVEYFYFLEVT